MTTWTEHDSHRLTISFVVNDGHRMPLRGPERAEAIRAMVARGLKTTTIAHRLCLDPENLRRWARVHNITIPPERDEQPWWVAVSCPASTTAGRRRQKQAQRARAAAATTRSC